MVKGIKFIETYNHDDFCNELYDVVLKYESEGYEVEIKTPHIISECVYSEFDSSVTGVDHIYTCLVLAKEKEEVVVEEKPVEKTTRKAKSE